MEPFLSVDFPYLRFPLNHKTSCITNISADDDDVARLQGIALQYETNIYAGIFLVIEGKVLLASVLRAPLLLMCKYNSVINLPLTHKL